MIEESGAVRRLGQCNLLAGPEPGTIGVQAVYKYGEASPSLRTDIIIVRPWICTTANEDVERVLDGEMGFGPPRP